MTMKKIIPIAAIAGLIITIIYSLTTAAVSGHNTATGEAIELSGWKAVYVYIDQVGTTSYVLNLLPAFLTFSALIAFSIYYIQRKKRNNSDL